MKTNTKVYIERRVLWTMITCLVVAILIIGAISTLAISNSLEKSNLVEELKEKNHIIEELQTTVSNQTEIITTHEETITKKDREIEMMREPHHDSDKFGNSWVNELFLELTSKEVNHTAYHIRNEILYHNKNNISRVEAAYRALWYWSQGKKYFGEDTYLTTAISIVENRMEHYDSNKEVVKNHKGAIGAMQTTHWVETQFGLDTTVFENNIIGATKFIKYQLDVYDEDVELALGHYNGGSRPWHKIEHYPETKEYVEKVTLIYETMEEKYGHE